MTSEVVLLGFMCGLPPHHFSLLAQCIQLLIISCSYAYVHTQKKHLSNILIKVKRKRLELYSGAASHKWMDIASLISQQNKHMLKRNVSILTPVVGLFNMRMSTVLMGNLDMQQYCLDFSQCVLLISQPHFRVVDSKHTWRYIIIILSLDYINRYWRCIALSVTRTSVGSCWRKWKRSKGD